MRERRLDVVALDASRVGIREVARGAAARALGVDACVAHFTDLPFADGAFGHVLAWNVVYHGDGRLAGRAFAECHRVVGPGGTFQFTMRSKRHRAFGIGTEIEPDTLVDETGSDDKAHPHLYVDETGLARLLAVAGFRAVSVDDVDTEPPGGFRLLVLAASAEPERVGAG